MADRELSTVLNSGEINSIYLGGVTSDDKAVKQSALATEQGRITTLENFSEFEYTKVTNHTVSGTTFEAVASLNATKTAGTYQVNQSMLYSLDNTNTSAYFRFSVDGGANWTEVRREPKDNTDKEPMAAVYVLPHAGGTMDIQIQARKENAGDVLEIYSLDLMVERKA